MELLNLNYHWEETEDLGKHRYAQTTKDDLIYFQQGLGVSTGEAPWKFCE